ncbi:TonB-dependent receptor plug domain-containing protein [Pedobacter sp. N36a]|uniref:TonB-dependent receptor plug domain-containing protein n=1 Tax=Pedobacter sp. N36a TaxID=2767996 RepID=UPI00165749AF|nr:TonB-dependent receptor plug domain-containing protein [Pedobacter sp. N36a]MBC8984287.1 TonB-dependent receptor plug domain-containing protein [Pedobacter sp. N36a]
MNKKRFVALIITAIRISVSQIFLVILFTCSTFAKKAEAQGVLNKEISINMNEGKIRQLLQEIQSLTKVKFIYSPSAIKFERMTSLNVVNRRLKDILVEVLGPLNITYKVVDQHILLYDKGSLAAVAAGLEKPVVIIKGQVTSVKGETLPEVSVKIKGTSIGAMTDLNGNYAINTVSADVTLVFTYIGFMTKEVFAADKAIVNVESTEAPTSLGDVVVVGYAAQKKKDLTGAVSVVNVSEMLKQPTASVANLLKGQASGVTVLGSGQPGEQPQIKIRGINTFGNNSPLSVVDGVPTERFADINPNDIESVQVLKDAGSAFIYGSRAANGVIVITKKKGKGKVQVIYDAYYGTQRPKTGNVWDLLSPAEMATLKRRMLINSGETNLKDDLYGNGPTYELPDYILPKGAKEGDPSVNPNLYNVIPFFISDAEYKKFYRITRANKEGTNWYEEIFSPAPITSHNVTVSGGSDQGNYLLSANYFNQKGTLMNTYLERYTLRSNTQFNISKKLRVGENFS